MIKYDWQKIKKICGYETVNILQYFCFRENLWMPSYLPKEYSHIVFKYAKLHPYPKGNSYIKNIVPVLQNKRGFYINEIYDYIHLASLRSYFDYKVRQIDTLPVVIGKANKMDLNNPLIEIVDNNIHFNYEYR